MADFSALKTSIQNYIKQNGNEEITGNLLQQILLSMVTTLGDSAINDLVAALNAEIATRGNADTELGGSITTLQGVVNGIKNNTENGYVYAGIATPSTTPVSGKVFYLALTAGTYTNFGATVVPQGINILKYNGTSWSLDIFIGVDDAPTANSPKLVKSGGVFDKVMTDGSAFDISAHFASGGTLATYADLSAALTALNTLSADYKRGGMSIKFVQSSDNKYVQYRLMNQNWSTIESDWQGVDDTLIPRSNNLVKSGVVYEEISQVNSKVDDISIDGAATVEIGTSVIEIKDDEDNDLASINEDGIKAKDFFFDDEDGIEVSVKEQIAGIENSIINGDATIVLGFTGSLRVLNDNENEICTIDNEGIHSPTIKETRKLYDAYIIPSYGQSLAIGVGGGGTTFQEIEPFAYNENLGKTGISDMCQGIAEGFRLSAEKEEIVFPNRTKIITFAVGTGGISVKDLSKDGTYGYNQLISAITTAKGNCDNSGLSCIVPAIAFTQGEEDMRCGGVPSRYGTTGYDPFDYHETLITLINDLNTDIKAITGQNEDIVFVIYQTSSNTSYKRYPRIALEQGKADELSARVYLVKPNYNVEYLREGQSSDPGTQGLTGYEVHCPNKSYREMGNHYGIAAFEYAILGNTPSRCYPTKFIPLGNVMKIRFNVPVYPLVLDTENVNNLPDGNYGFCVYNVTEGIGETGTIAKAETTIESVVISDIDEVTITFNRTPQAGERLTYGVNGDYWDIIDGVSEDYGNNYEVNDHVTKSGNLHGTRGCLRDSSMMENTETGSYYHNLYNWCRIFEFNF